MEDFARMMSNGDYRRISLYDAECYRQRCLNRGNSPATVTKTLTEVKCVFNAAVARNQFDENPLRHIKMPKCAQNEISIYSDNECERILEATRDFTEDPIIRDG